MSYGSTISRKELTEIDQKVINFCKEMSNKMKDEIQFADGKKKFHNDFGKTNLSRDAGSGRGAGKLQRDALTTRGSGTGRAPISNRNLRWHPVTIAHVTPPNQIEGKIQIVKFKPGKYKIKLIVNGKEWEPEDTYKLPVTVCIPETSWNQYTDVLREWKPEDWRFSRYTIRAFEYSTPVNCIESYAILGIAVASTLYEANFSNLYTEITGMLENFEFVTDLPTRKYPKAEKEIKKIVKCPFCSSELSEQPAYTKKRERPPVFSPPWRTKKRKEGDDASLQIMHILPLVEHEIRHHANNVRYGHRWCNVAMTDHSVTETLDFMNKALELHEEK